ncbi:GNAT family N-acetyltransferase [bacterium]|nr:GNAT family N-acetyltransferase [bacterium]
MEIKYSLEKVVLPKDIIRVFTNSGIKRPVDDIERIEKMFKYSDIVCSAWSEGNLVGVGRALSDFSYCCYVSDIAVDQKFQNLGIGKKIVDLIQEKAGDRCSFFLKSAESAKDYYPKIGFQTGKNYFEIARKF